MKTYESMLTQGGTRIWSKKGLFCKHCREKLGWWVNGEPDFDADRDLTAYYTIGYPICQFCLGAVARQGDN
jgi:hypothetical protein